MSFPHKLIVTMLKHGKCFELIDMQMARWDRTVTINIGDERRPTVLISNTKDAAYCLLEMWPKKSGNCYRRAIMNCASVLRGDLPETYARISLVVAAMEAMLPVEVSPETMDADPFFAEIGEVCEQILFEELSIHLASSPAKTYRLTNSPS